MNPARRISVLGFILLGAAVTQADPSPEIAALYVDAAHEAIERGDIDHARSLVDVALEFDGVSSDVLYLSAYLGSLVREETARAVRRATEARVGSTWRRYSDLHSAVLLARLSNRISKPDEAIGILSSTEITPDAVDSLLSDYYYEYLRALYALGRIAEADARLGLARDRFPDDPRYFLLALRSEPYPSGEYREELVRIMGSSRSQESDQWTGLLLHEYARKAPVASERRWALDRLVELDWNDPRWALLLAESDPALAVEIVLDRGGLADFTLFMELLRFLPDRERLLIEEAADRFTGSSVVDAEYDGWWNERLTVRDGRINRWERDSDQDGVVELDVVFAEGVPQTATLRNSDGTIMLDYGQYPYLSEGRIETEAGYELYVLRPRAVALGVMEPLSAGGARLNGESRIASVVRSVARRELVAAAIRIDHIRPDGTIAERSYNQGGTRRQILRDERGDGSWDHLLITDGGLAVSGLRDLNGDGYFEVAEGYRNGTLVVLAIDSDGNGVADVFERYGSVDVREWDLNGDGRIDVREFSIWTDSVVREFPLVERAGER